MLFRNKIFILCSSQFKQYKFHNLNQAYFIHNMLAPALTFVCRKENEAKNRMISQTQTY